MPVRCFVVSPVAAVLALTAAAHAAAPLPLERVVLFTSGVGYF